MNLILEAAKFATIAHSGQKRKYCNEDYIWHPMRVASRIMIVQQFPIFEEQVAAALLHDIIEDTDVCSSKINKEFGPIVYEMVIALTNPIKDKFLLRSERKAIDRKHLRNASLPVKMIKLADRIDNLKGLDNAPPEFRKTYWEESVLLRQVLTFVHSELEKELDDILLNFKF
jgi:(p)ppGpp synthase/HD superfamily hydrolase